MLKMPTRFCGIRIPKKLLDELDEVAKGVGITRSRLINRLLTLSLSQVKEQAAQAANEREQFFKRRKIGEGRSK